MIDETSCFALEPDPGFNPAPCATRKGPINAGFGAHPAKINMVKYAVCFVNMPISRHTSGTARGGGTEALLPPDGERP